MGKKRETVETRALQAIHNWYFLTRTGEGGRAEDWSVKASRTIVELEKIGRELHESHVLRGKK
jgi:hypothetical protein